MQKKSVVIGALLGVMSAPAWSIDNQDPAIQELLHKLEARDRLIADLQRRVSQLERMVGAKKTFPRAERSKSQKPAQPGTGQVARAQVAKQPPARQKAKAGAFEVDEEAAERALERTLTQVGALLLPFGQGEIQPFFTYSRVEAFNPLVVNRGGDLLTVHQKLRLNEFDMGVFTRFGLPFDAQLELSLPYTVTDRTRVNDLAPVGGGLSQSSSRSVSRLADIRVGVAKTLFREKGWRPDLIARLTWTAPTGRWQADQVLLGGGFHRLRGSLTALKRQDPLAFSGTFFYEGAFDEHNDNPGDRYGFTVGAFLAASPETSLSLALQQVFIDEFKVNGRTIRGSDRVVSSFVLGASSIIAKKILLSVSGGIGLTDDAPDYFVNISVPIRFDVPFVR